MDGLAPMTSSAHRIGKASHGLFSVATTLGIWLILMGFGKAELAAEATRRQLKGPDRRSENQRSAHFLLDQKPQAVVKLGIQLS